MPGRIAQFLWVSATVLVLGASVAQATATTHVWGPSTDVQPFKLCHVTADMYLPVESDAAGNRIATVTNLGLTVGVLPFRAFQMEVGADHKSGLGTLDDDPLYGNVKLGVPEGAFGSAWPAMAAGVLDVGTRVDRTDYNLCYAKLAKTFAADSVSLGRFSVGYFAGNRDLLRARDGDADEQGWMLAWERTVGELSDKLWVCVEYMGTESLYGTVSLGASWKFAPTVALLAGYSRFNNRDVPGTATVQVDIDF